MTLLKREGKKNNRSCIVLAFLFSLFTVGGFYLETQKTGLPERLTERAGTMLAFLALPVLFLCLFLALGFLFQGLDKTTGSELLKKREGEKCLYGKWLEERPILTGFFTLLAIYLPYTVISFPGLFMGDVGKTLMQGFGIWPLYSQQPPVYTLLITGILKAGYLIFHSWNAAAMLAAALQMLLLFTVIAGGNRLLIRRGLRWEASAVYLAYFCISLVVSNYMMLLTKDVWYAAFFFLWILGLADVLTGRRDARPLLTVIAGMLGMLCFRNEAVLVLLLSLPLCALFDRRHAKKLLAFTGEAALLYGILTLLLYPLLGIDNDGIDENSRRDLFSPVFQQTARTVVTHRDKITPEEEAAILAVFSFETLDEMAVAYSPDYADDVKNEFHARFGSEEAARYFETWREMGKKYPKSYFMATIANIYQYFYPFSPFWVYTYDYSADNMALVNEMLSFTDFHYPDALSRARDALEKIRDTAYSVLPLSLFNGSGVVAWVMMIMTAWILSRRKKEKLAMLIPLWVVFILCLFSPCNGSYGRYQYPIFIALPWILVLCLLPKTEAQ